jgi:CHAT domain-containing protein/tetratricopeptide (TPR) repeat protein
VLRFLLLVALAPLAQRSAAQTADDPRSIVRAATRAIEGDTAKRVEARWRQRIDRTAGDRPALLGLATLAQHRYDYPLSESLYRRLIAGASDRYSVYAHLGLADAGETRGAARDALEHLQQALAMSRAIRDRVAEADALLTLAFARGRLAGVRVASAYIDSAATLVPDTAFDLRSRLLSRRAIVHALYGRAAPASAAADSSVLFARRANDRRLEADAYRIIGQVLQYRSQLDSAFVALRRSELLYTEAHDRAALARSLIWHAQVLGSRMRYGEMRDVARRALSEGEATHNPAAISSAHRVLGVLAQMLGDWPASSAHLKRAVAISAAVGDSSGMLTSGKYLANVLLAAGDIPTAKRLARERLDLAQKTDDANERYETYRLLANIAERENDVATVIRSLDSARAQLKRLPGGDYPVWLLHDDARHALARNDLAAAERSLDAYLDLAKRGTCDVCIFDSRMRLADIYARRGEIARAEQELVSATDDIDRFRARLGDAELRTLAFQSAVTVDAAATEPGATAVRAARVLAALVNGGRVEVAFTLAERWRARELTERLVRASALRAEQPSRVVSASSVPVRAARDISASLVDGETGLIEFVAAEGAPITAFVVQQSGVRAKVLGPVDSLAASIARFSTLLESGAEAARLGRSLGATVLDPVLPLLDARVKRIVIVPDGPLHRLPFDAIRLADGHYLFERYAVGIAPSASAVVALRARPGQSGQATSVRMLAIGDPAIALPARDTSREGDTDDELSMITKLIGTSKLVGAAREARLVARYAPTAEVRLRGDATAAFLRRTDLRQYRVLHFATHAFVDEQSLTRTALALTPSDGENGLVGPGDLAALSLNADLVVLSACRSAGGVLVGGEGVQGLTSPLLQAGARSVVATNWRISDERVVPFVERFYDGLAGGLTVTDALRAAKVAAVKAGEPPQIWAAFLAIGDPLVTVPLRTPRKSWWAWMVPSRPW